MKPVMFVGTGSNVGKSIITAAFGRVFKQDGWNPAPFKAQNMSLNSYATTEGLEIGRAQAMQAEACGIQCCADMNPVLLKPTSQMSSQVVLNGKPIGNQTASDYFLKTDREWLFTEALRAFKRLEAMYHPMVLEGAGSISEINLWDKDITNMRMALAVNAAVFLVADIDRGGVFGNVFGTLQLLPEKERELVKGIVINKFRGDIALFQRGREMMEQLTGIPVVGIIPWFKDIYLDDEDSVVIESKQQHGNTNKINIAVILLQHMSNFTDFNFLERLPEVHLFYATHADDLKDADVVIIPGSKNTISDMSHLRKSGMAAAILRAHDQGKAVYGICGGYQMMGREILDPYHVEGEIKFMPGLGLLPVVTTITTEKVTEQCSFQFLQSPGLCKGYEIHMGESFSEGSMPLCKHADGKTDGCFVNSKTWGTYFHGIFDNEIVVKYILENNGLVACLEVEDQVSFKDRQYDRLADLVRNNVDMRYVYQVMERRF